MKLWTWLRQEGTRAYLYRLAVAAGVVLVGYGLMTAEQAAMWAGFVAVAFAVPAFNTRTPAQIRQDEQLELLEQLEPAEPLPEPRLPDPSRPADSEPIRWVRRG